MPWSLYHQGNSPWHPIDRKPDGPQSQSELGGEEKESPPLPGLKHWLFSVHSLVISSPLAQEIKRLR